MNLLKMVRHSLYLARATDFIFMHCKADVIKALHTYVIVVLRLQLRINGLVKHTIQLVRAIQYIL